MNENKPSAKRFSIVISVFLAVLLWLYVINVENPNATMTLSNVPVTLQGVTELQANGLVVTELSRDEMKLRVTGKRKTFIQLNQSQVAVRLDVSKIREPGIYTIAGEYMISNASIRNAFTISEADSFFVTVTVEERESKQISLQAEFGGTLAPGYEVASLSAQPGSIMISGPEDVIDEVSHAVVVMHGEQVKEGLVQRGLSILLVDESGNIIEDSSITKNITSCTATMTVIQVFELPLSVLLVPGGGAGPLDAEVTITPPSITVTGNESVLAELTELNLGRVELADIFSNQFLSFPITLPAGVASREEETTATVFVSLRDLSMRAITVTDIALLNPPDGYEASLVNSTIQVWLRGNENILNSITSSQIRVLVNLEGISPAVGQQRVAANVYLDADTQIGIVGSDYSVAVKFSR